MAITLIVDRDGFHFSGSSHQITKDKNALLADYGKMIHNYGLVLELLPNTEKISLFRQFIGCARLVHNDFITENRRVYKEEERYLSVSEYKKTRLKQLKEDKEFLKAPDKFALETAIENADAAYQNYFAGRAKKPKFVSRRKPNGNKYTTRATNGNLDITVVNGIPCVKLPKIGFVPFVMPKGKAVSDLLPKGVRITKATISCRDDRWFVSFCMEAIIELVTDVTEVHVNDIMAGDAGIKEFLIYGNMDAVTHVPNEKYIKKHEKRLRRFQKMLSRRQYNQETHTGSKRWEKAKKLVSREQQKTANQRKDFQHKLSRKIADKCTVFIREDLNVKGMMKNHHLSKAIASVGWFSFFEKLEYKLKRKGGCVIKVARMFPSSQLCSSCGTKNPITKDLSVREWTCPNCGTHHDRDENAKKNLLTEGMRILRASGVVIRGMELIPYTADT